jgi:hypothetical protein
MVLNYVLSTIQGTLVLHYSIYSFYQNQFFMSKGTNKTKTIKSFEEKEIKSITNKEQATAEGGKRSWGACVDWLSGGNSQV